MMYRHTSQRRKPASAPRRRRRRRTPWGLVVVLLVASGCIYAFINHSDKLGDDSVVQLFTFSDNHEGAVADAALDESSPENLNVVRARIERAAIPPHNFNAVGFRELFNDSNYVQLSSARACGINPHTLGDPAKCDALVPIVSNAYYQVDTMYHAVPYLVPEAALLLHFIALRFHELMEEQCPDMADYKCVVTSALRTEASERQLRRVNRNATDTSCHIYGTTFDISAQRFVTPDGRDTVVDPCRQVLAQALYEIRYEGLCYVKYERGSCFHTTLRTTQYEGSLASSEHRYCNPGSPTYQHTKSVPRPPYSAGPSASQPVSSSPQAAATVHRKQSASTAARPVKARRASTTTPVGTKNTKNTNKNTTTTPSHPAATHSPVTDRERLSLEQYERRY